MTEDPVKKLLAEAEAAAPDLANSDDEFVAEFVQQMAALEAHRVAPSAMAFVPAHNLIRLGRILRAKGPTG